MQINRRNLFGVIGGAIATATLPSFEAKANISAFSKANTRRMILDIENHIADIFYEMLFEPLDNHTAKNIKEYLESYVHYLYWERKIISGYHVMVDVMNEDTEYANIRATIHVVNPDLTSYRISGKFDKKLTMDTTSLHALTYS